MGRIFCKIGFGEKEVETSPGVIEVIEVEKDYYAELFTNNYGWDRNETLNDNISFNNRLSFIADNFALQNFQDIRYIIYLNTKWKVEKVEISRPRITVSFRGVYNA